MVELLRSPWEKHLNQLIAEAKTSVLLSSPYIGAGPCERLCRQVLENGAENLEIAILTDLSRDNMLTGGVDVGALAALVLTLPRASVRFLPSLHAKVYVADDRHAIVTSANMTDSGLYRNFEYGVAFRESKVVTRIRDDVLQYSALGSPIDGTRLTAFAAIIDELKIMLRRAERAGEVAYIRREFDQRAREVDDEVLRARAAGRSAHAIFADAILHLLRRGPLRTVEINSSIQCIHPDLCDDTIDRVIDGQHFGKKWKHGVRTAQVFLRRRGDIELVEGRWQMARTTKQSRRKKR